MDPRIHEHAEIIVEHSTQVETGDNVGIVAPPMATTRSSAIGECVPEGEPENESATHMDVVVDMSEDSYIEVDGEVVQRNGTFKFESGFEG